MKKFIITFLLVLIPSLVVAQDSGELVGDPSVDTGHIIHTRQDSTGGLQKPGGIHFFGLNPNLRVRGFDLNVSKKGLDNYRGSDLTGPCAFLGNSTLSSSETDCQGMLVTAGAASVCDTGYVLDRDGNCIPQDCPVVGQVKDENGNCITDCPAPDQTEDTPGKCKCVDPAKVINSMGQCEVGCQGNQEDIDGDGDCDCPIGYFDEPDQNGICHVDCKDGCKDVNNECVTICPTGKEDPDTNTCDPNNCVDPNPCPDGMFKNSNNVCQCNGNTIEIPAGSQNCDCPPGSDLDPNSPISNPICECYNDKVWKNQVSGQNGPNTICECQNSNEVWSAVELCH